MTGYEIVETGDASKFSLNSSTRELRFLTAPNYEDPQDAGDDNRYVVVVRATSGTGSRVKRATLTIVVTVIDIDEPPDKPDPPSVSPASETSLDGALVGTRRTMGRQSPATIINTRRRAIRIWRQDWTEGTTTELSVTISDLETDIEYEVQIRAKNDEGESDWSDSGRGSPGSTEANAAPEFISDDEVDVSENTTFVLTVQAEDSDPDDNIERYEIVGGADQGQFSIVSSTGVLRFRTAPNYEDPQDVQSATPSNAADNNEYVVVVRATSGTGDREKTADSDHRGNGDRRIDRHYATGNRHYATGNRHYATGNRHYATGNRHHATGRCAS